MQALIVAWLMSAPLSAQLVGGNTYPINGTSNPPTSFATVREAITYLNTNGTTGGGQITLLVTTGYPGENAASGTIRLTLNISPNTPVVLTTDIPATISTNVSNSANSRFVIQISGMGYFTIDGAGLLTIQPAGSASCTSCGVIGVDASGTLPKRGIEIKKCKIYGAAGNRNNTGVGIYFGPDQAFASSINPTTGLPYGAIVIDSNVVRGVGVGIFATSNIANLGFVIIRGNEVGYKAATTAGQDSSFLLSGIRCNSINATIEGNYVHDFVRSTGSFVTLSELRGIYVQRCPNAQILRNRVSNLEYTGTSGYGMQAIRCDSMRPDFNWVIENNMISNIRSDGDVSSSSLTWVPGGIVLDNGYLFTNSGIGGIYVLHNSINLYGTLQSSSYNGLIAGIIVDTLFKAGLEIKYNLISNTATFNGNPPNKKVYAIAALPGNPTTGSFIATLAHNRYHVGSNSNTFIGRIAGSDRNLSSWQSVTGDNSLAHAPGSIPFLSNEDLHLDPSVQSNAINTAIGSSTPIDIDGDARPTSGSNDSGTNPDIGADELAGTQLQCPTTLSGGTISATPSSIFLGQSVVLDTVLGSPYSGFPTWQVSYDGGATWTDISSTVPLNHTPTPTGTLPATVQYRLKVDDIPGCPPAGGPVYSNVVSVTVTCPTPNGGDATASVAGGPTGNTVNALIRQDVTVSSTGASGTTFIWQYATSATGPYTNFPNTIPGYNTPSAGPLTSATPGTYYVRLAAIVGSPCPADTQYSDTLIVTFAPRTPGNEATNPISLTLTYNSSTQKYELTYQDSTTHFTSDYTGRNHAPSPDGFYRIILPSCMDSLVVTTCHPFTNYDTRIHMLNTTVGDSTFDDDMGSVCTGVPFPSPAYLSKITVLSRSNALSYSPLSENFSNPTRDTMLLRGGDTLLLVVEGYGASDYGRFGLSIEATPAPLSSNIRVGTTDYNNGASYTVTAPATVQYVANSSASGNTYSWQNTGPAGTVSGTAGDTFTVSYSAAGNDTIVLTTTNYAGCSKKDTLYVTITTSTSLGTNLASQVSLYPNPNMGTFTLRVPQSGSYAVDILDMTGRTVHTQVIEGTTELRTSLPAGVYQVRVRHQGDQVVLPMVISN
ncbi:MAG: T9SS type A sorting domain-containing protein [Bacteroidia bacterium]